MIRSVSWLKANWPRRSRALGYLCLTVVLSACAGMHPYPYSQPPSIEYDHPEPLRIAEPGLNEVIVVVNDNQKMVHAGMFVGKQLFDPAGSYLAMREGEATWHGASLQDYVRFQLEDGPAVKLYRFYLSPEHLAQVKARMDLAGTTFPIFCATKVQNIISGITPFETVPTAWLVTPAVVGDHLDVILHTNKNAGLCQWPDASPCYLAP